MGDLPAELALEPLDRRRGRRRAGGDDAHARGTTSPRVSAGALASEMSTVGAAHIMATCSSLISRNTVAGSTLRRQTWVPAGRRHGPGVRPAVGVEHRQRPQVPLADAIGRCTSVPMVFIYALRWVIITPFGRAVVPLV